MNLEFMVDICMAMGKDGMDDTERVTKAQRARRAMEKTAGVKRKAETVLEHRLRADPWAAAMQGMDTEDIGKKGVFISTTAAMAARKRRPKRLLVRLCMWKRWMTELKRRGSCLLLREIPCWAGC